MCGIYNNEIKNALFIVYDQYLEKLIIPRGGVLKSTCGVKVLLPVNTTDVWHLFSDCFLTEYERQFAIWSRFLLYQCFLFFFCDILLYILKQRTKMHPLKREKRFESKCLNPVVWISSPRCANLFCFAVDLSHAAYNLLKTLLKALGIITPALQALTAAHW